MIRFYAYYSVGGYKDFYLGNSAESASSTYLLPLLDQLLGSRDPKKKAKGERQLALPKIEMITVDDNHEIPDECLRLFTHGGYRAMCLDTESSNGRCFIVRDLSNGSVDEEGRSIPYVLAIVAEGAYDINRLDSFAIRYCTEMAALDESLGKLLGYDGLENGIRFDLKECLEIVDHSQPALFTADEKKVRYIVAGSLELANVVCEELGFTKKDVECVINNEGNTVYGELKVSYSQTTLQGTPDLEKKTDAYPDIIESKSDDAISEPADTEIKLPKVESVNNDKIPENEDTSEERNETIFSEITKQIQELSEGFQGMEEMVSKKVYESIGQQFESLLKNCKSLQEKITAIEGRLIEMETKMTSMRGESLQKGDQILNELKTLKSDKKDSGVGMDSPKPFWKNTNVLAILGAITIATIIMIIVCVQSQTSCGCVTH